MSCHEISTRFGLGKPQNGLPNRTWTRQPLIVRIERRTEVHRLGVVPCCASLEAVRLRVTSSASTAKPRHSFVRDSRHIHHAIDSASRLVETDENCESLSQRAGPADRARMEATTESAGLYLGTGAQNCIVQGSESTLH